MPSFNWNELVAMGVAPSTPVNPTVDTFTVMLSTGEFVEEFDQEEESE
jgi:hypothetical protein